MVKILLISLLAAGPISLPAAGPAPSGVTATASSPETASPTAKISDQDFPETPASPRLPKLEKNNPAEDFLVVTTISLPFMALYSFLGATAIAYSSSHTFPPAFSNNLVTGAAATAVGASFTIAALSVNWGGSQPSEPAPRQEKDRDTTGPDGRGAKSEMDHENKFKNANLNSKP